MTAGAVEETFNSPYYGFNEGATKIKLVNRTLDKNDIFNSFDTATNEPVDNSVPDTRPPVDWTRTLWVLVIGHPPSVNSDDDTLDYLLIELDLHSYSASRFGGRSACSTRSRSESSPIRRLRTTSLR